MLIGISPSIGPELLEALHRMGHGDEIVLVDAFYPGDTRSSRCIRADGITVEQLLDGILRLMNPDDYVKDPIVMMQPSEGDSADPKVEASFQAVIDAHWPEAPKIQKIEREAFYQRSKAAYAVVVSGSIVKYGCIIIRKGVLPH